MKVILMKDFKFEYKIIVSIIMICILSFFLISCDSKDDKDEAKENNKTQVEK